MKKNSWIWYALGAIVLLVVGFAAGYFLTNTQGAGSFMMGRRIAPLMAHPFLMQRGIFPMGGFMFFGLFRLLGGLGWVAGIVALILVLTRRSSPSQPVVTAAPEPPTAVSEKTKSS